MTATTEEQPAATVSRSPTDILRLVVAVGVLLVLVVIGLLFDDAIVGFVDDLLRGFDALPGWVVSAIGLVGRTLVLVVIVGGLVVSLFRGRVRLLLTIALAGAIAAVLFALAKPLADEAAAAVTQLDDVAGPLTNPGFPSGYGVAVVTAGVTAAAPWVARRWRRAGWALVLILAAARFVVAPVSFDTAIALATGWVGGAAAVVILGAPVRRPTREQVIEGLAAVGVPLAELEKAGVDARGSTPYFGRTNAGQALFVKALGEDERSADLLFRLYRYVQPRNLGDEKPFSTLRRAVEHEALVALAARDLGIRTPRLVAFATAEPAAYVLAYEAVSGRSFDRLDDAEVDDAVLGAVWSQVTLLRDHRIAHRDLRLANIFLADDGEVWMIDFGFSELAASDRLLATDLAELLASSSLQVGVERAVAQGRQAVGAAALQTALDRLSPHYLSGATRTGLGESRDLLPALRTAVEATAPAVVLA
jgi:glycosyltransferase 2 family protein